MPPLNPALSCVERIRGTSLDDWIAKDRRHFEFQRMYAQEVADKNLTRLPDHYGAKIREHSPFCALEGGYNFESLGAVTITPIDDGKRFRMTYLGENIGEETPIPKKVSDPLYTREGFANGLDIYLIQKGLYLTDVSFILPWGDQDFIDQNPMGFVQNMNNGLVRVEGQLHRMVRP